MIINFSCKTQYRPLVLPTCIRLGWKNARVIHSKFICPFVSDEEKDFINFFTGKVTIVIEAQAK
jgi:hypothetical protein